MTKSYRIERVNKVQLPEFTWTDDGKREITDIEWAVECGCCHQVVGQFEVILRDGQELCKECAK